VDAVSSSGKGGATQLREKLFQPEFLSIETEFLKSIENVQDAPRVAVQAGGDMTKVNAMIEKAVLIQDAIVKGFLRGSEDPEYLDYTKEREALIKQWVPDQGTGATDPRVVLQLLEFNIYTIAKRRLFHVKKQAFFGVGWKMMREFNMKKLMNEEERAGEEDEESLEAVAEMVASEG
jgi:hypothetical protein